jgi:hypothetical protein
MRRREARNHLKERWDRGSFLSLEIILEFLLDLDIFVGLERRGLIVGELRNFIAHCDVIGVVRLLSRRTITAGVAIIIHTHSDSPLTRPRPRSATTYQARLTYDSIALDFGDTMAPT